VLGVWKRATFQRFLGEKNPRHELRAPNAFLGFDVILKSLKQGKLRTTRRAESDDWIFCNGSILGVLGRRRCAEVGQLDRGRTHILINAHPNVGLASKGYWDYYNARTN